MRVPMFIVSVRVPVVVPMRVTVVVFVRVVVLLSHGLRAPRENEVSMGCRVGVAVDAAAMPVSQFRHGARVPSQAGPRLVS